MGDRKRVVLYSFHFKGPIFLLLAVSSISPSIASGSSSDCSLLAESIVSRSKWANSGGQEAYLERFRARPRHVFVHHTWSQDYDQPPMDCDSLISCSLYLRNLQRRHKSINNWPDIGYNFLIAPDGTTFEGLGWSRPGFHTLNYNNDSLGVALIGNYEWTAPTNRLELALKQLLRCAVELEHLRTDYSLHGHRDARCTSCPGGAAYERIQALPHYRPGPLERYSCPPIAPRLFKRSATLNIGHKGNIQPPSISTLIQREHDESAVFEETLIGLVRHRKQALARNETSQVKEAAAISKTKSSDKLVVMSVPTVVATSVPAAISPSNEQIIQPSFYLLTTKAKTVPAILLTSSNGGAPNRGSTSESSGAPGGNMGSMGGEGGMRPGGGGRGAGPGPGPGSGSGGGRTPGSQGAESDSDSDDEREGAVGGRGTGGGGGGGSAGGRGTTSGVGGARPGFSSGQNNRQQEGGGRGSGAGGGRPGGGAGPGPGAGGGGGSGSQRFRESQMSSESVVSGESPDRPTGGTGDSAGCWSASSPGSPSSMILALIGKMHSWLSVD